MQCLQCSDFAPFYLTFAKLSRLELFYSGSISVHAPMNRQDSVLKENCLLIKRPADSACQPGTGRCEKLVAAICVLMGSHKGSGAATTSEPVMSAVVSEPVHEFVPPPAPIFFELAPFTVTVENGITERILHVGMTLRLADEMSRHRLENYLPEVRNRILLELAKLSPDDLKGAQGRVDLASAIVDTLNRPFAPQPVGQYITDVLFTAFVVQ